MSYNTGLTKHRSTYLEGLDCGFNLKAVPIDDNYPEGHFVSSSTRVVGVGECVAMIRVPANTIILGAEFFWDDAAPAAIVAIGDPYACGRILGPIHVGTARGIFAGSTFTCGAYWGTCGSLSKMGRTATGHEGCGFGYKYTCETDIVMTNLYSDANATMGGWPGSSAALGSQTSVAITAGSYSLILHTKKATSLT